MGGKTLYVLTCTSISIAIDSNLRVSSVAPGCHQMSRSWTTMIPVSKVFWDLVYIVEDVAIKVAFIGLQVTDVHQGSSIE